jgi:hypothetical protein
VPNTSNIRELEFSTNSAAIECRSAALAINFMRHTTKQQQTLSKVPVVHRNMPPSDDDLFHDGLRALGTCFAVAQAQHTKQVVSMSSVWQELSNSN